MNAVYVENNKYDLLSKFESLKEFNNHFEQAMLLHKDKFTKSEYIALNKLRKYAAEIFGVAWCKAQKAVSATHKDAMFGISRSTFDRMLSKAKKLNLIKVVNQYRKNKYQKHNVYVFNRLEELTPGAFEVVEIVSKSTTIDVSESMKIDEPRTILLKLPRIKENNKTYSQAKNVPSEQGSKFVDFKEKKTEYQQINEKIMDMFNDKKITYKIYGAYLELKRKFDLIKPPFELALKATKVLLAEVKRRIAKDIEPLNNPVGYFKGILYNMIDQWNENEMRRYEDDWEQAMIEDGSAFENCENHSNEVEEDILTPLMDISLSRYNYFKQYIDIKKREITFAGVDLERYMNRMKRLLHFDKLLDRCHVVSPHYDWANVEIDFEAERQKVLDKLYG